ncbi:hypothetical protein [Undibacterium danionis]|uniref:Uncharacterized protein n=1 Tax=Undibacterium danionis TaxID=1812100 RepID=A0ABV6ID01_9BURK
MTRKAERLETSIKLLKAEHKANLDATENAGKKRLIEANDKANLLAENLRSTQDELKEVKERKQHEIVKYATNRTCFNADLVRVLNSGTEAGGDSSGMSKAIPSVDATDEAVTTDTDVALWINNAKEQYEVCRARYHALIDFNPSKPIVPIQHD